MANAAAGLRGAAADPQPRPPMQPRPAGRELPCTQGCPRHPATLLPMTPSAPYPDPPTPLTIWLPGWGAHKERTPCLEAHSGYPFQQINEWLDLCFSFLLVSECELAGLTPSPDEMRFLPSWSSQAQLPGKFIKVRAIFWAPAFLPLAAPVSHRSFQPRQMHPHLGTAR